MTRSNVKRRRTRNCHGCLHCHVAAAHGAALRRKVVAKSGHYRQRNWLDFAAAFRL